MPITLTTSKPELWKQTLTWEEIESLISSGACRRALILGLPGLGKTHLVASVARNRNKSLSALTLTDATREETLVGQFTLRPRENGSNEVVWKHGIAVEAWLNGGILLLNELSSRVAPEALHILHAILDDPDWTQLTLPNGETVRPAPGFQVVGTANDDDLPSALLDRFPTRIYVTAPHPAAILSLPKDLQVLASKTAALVNNDERIGIRQWIEFAKLREAFNAELACRAVFGEKARDMQNQIEAYGVKAAAKK